MSRYSRREDLIEKSLCYKLLGKRLCDCTLEEKREYFKIRKRESRKKDYIQEREKDYRANYWITIQKEKLNGKKKSGR